MIRRLIKILRGCIRQALSLPNALIQTKIHGKLIMLLRPLKESAVICSYLPWPQRLSDTRIKLRTKDVGPTRLIVSGIRRSLPLGLLVM